MLRVVLSIKAGRLLPSAILTALPRTARKRENGVSLNAAARHPRG